MTTSSADDARRSVLEVRPPTYRGDTDGAVAELRRLVADGWRSLVVTEGHGPAQRIVEVLAEHDVPSRLVADGADPAPGLVTVTTGVARPRLRRRTARGWPCSPRPT